MSEIFEIGQRVHVKESAWSCGGEYGEIVENDADAEQGWGVQMVDYEIIWFSTDELEPADPAPTATDEFADVRRMVALGDLESSWAFLEDVLGWDGVGRIRRLLDALDEARRELDALRKLIDYLRARLNVYMQESDHADE